MGKINLEKSKDNYNILRVNKDGKSTYLGSKYYQEREIDKFIKSFGVITEKDVFIVFGAGTLDHINILAEKKDEKSKILVVEVDSDIINVIKENKLDKKIKGKNEIIITNDIDTIKEFLSENILETNSEYIKMMAFGNYNKLYKEELVEPYKVIKDYIVNISISRNTKLFFNSDWVKSLLKNSKHLYKSTKINKLKDKYNDKPAIIVSAGPSLEKNIKDIDSSKAYIFSGGRTLRPLLDNKIDPDFMTVIDGGSVSYDLVKDVLDYTNSTLIYNEMTNGDILEEFKGSKIVSAQSGFMKDILGEDIEDIIKGGSVANAMIFSASYMGFNPIILVGQDLAYTNEKGHADCATCNGNIVDAKAGYYSESDVYIESIDGGMVRTSLVLKGFKESIEEQIKEFKNVKFINSTEGGALIKGMENIKLRDIIDELPIIEKKERISTVNNIELLNSTKNKLRLNIESTKYVSKLARKAKCLLDDFEKSYLSGRNDLNKINKKLDEIEKEIKTNVPKLQILNSLIYNLNYELESSDKFVINKLDSKDDIIRKKLSLNRKIYEGMENICESNIDLLEDAYRIMEKMIC